VELGLGDGTGLGGVDKGIVSESEGGEAGGLSLGGAEGLGGAEAGGLSPDDGDAGELSPVEGVESEFEEVAELSLGGGVPVSPPSGGKPFSTSVAFRFGSPISFACSPR
jgi:hypothetical protein